MYFILHTMVLVFPVLIPLLLCVNVERILHPLYHYYSEFPCDTIQYLHVISMVTLLFYFNMFGSDGIPRGVELI